jgi:glycosyltransferase involved in cell wall biosynthesis
LIADRKLRAAMGDRGRERAGLFAWDKIAERVAGLYSEHAGARMRSSTRRPTMI